MCFSVTFTKLLRAPFFIGKLQWLLVRFNSCFERSPGQNAMYLSSIHIREMLFLPHWDYCWKCEFDTDVKIENFITMMEDNQLLTKKYI